MILAFETGVSGGSIALVSAVGRKLAGWTGARGGTVRNEDLLPRVDELLREIGGERRDIGHLAVSSGPGSFTGIRVGIATGLGLKASLGASLSIVPPLEAIAFAHPNAASVVIPMGRGYAAVQRFLDGDPISRAASLAVDALADQARHGTPAVHADLVHDLSGATYIEIGYDLATMLAKYVQAKGPMTRDPLFLSKAD